VDFHLAALHGVRFEAELAAEAAGRVLASSRRLAAVGQEAWGWILLGQAEVARGRFAEAERAGTRARALQPDDPEIEALDEGTCRGLADLLRGDRNAALARWGRAIDLLRPLPRAPLSPWMLWPLVAAVWGGDAEQAMADTAHPALLVAPGIEGIRHLTAAVTAARAGDPPDAALAAAAECFERAPAWGGYRHVAQRLVAEAAIDDGWASSYDEPHRWLAETEVWADGHQLPTLAAQCRALSRRAGGPVRRRGRGASVVPPELASCGVTSREMDVLTLLATGRSNQAIADELYVAVRTVKTHVESLLRKTGSTNRVGLASLLSKPR
jgi:DNA-binding CsgD family transcriptional regulator